MRKFEFIWIDGKTEVGCGEDGRDAFLRLGYAGQACYGLKGYREVK